MKFVLPLSYRDSVELFKDAAKKHDVSSSFVISGIDKSLVLSVKLMGTSTIKFSAEEGKKSTLFSMSSEEIHPLHKKYKGSVKTIIQGIVLEGGGTLI